MKIKLHPIFALAWMGSQGAWANGSLDSFKSSLAPLSFYRSAQGVGGKRRFLNSNNFVNRLDGAG